MAPKGQPDLFLWNCAGLLEAKYGKRVRRGNYLRYNGKDEIEFRATLDNNNADAIHARINVKLAEFGFTDISYTYRREGKTAFYSVRFSKPAEA